jgi:hypothetical protein
MQESFDLGNECTKTFASSHKRIRTQEVNGKRKKERRRRKRKRKILTTTKKLIKLPNSRAAAPKT